jgi:hypothetical protein
MCVDVCCMLALVYFSKLSLVRFIFPPFDFVWMPPPPSTYFRVNMDIVLATDPSLKSVNSQPHFSWFVVCIIPPPLWQNPLFVDSEPNGSKLTTWTFKRFLKKKKKKLWQAEIDLKLATFTERIWHFRTSFVPAGLDSLYQRTFSRRITAYRKGCWYITTGWNLNKSCCSERNFNWPLISLQLLVTLVSV